jgi:hypothetical protein
MCACCWPSCMVPVSGRACRRAAWRCSSRPGAACTAGGAGAAAWRSTRWTASVRPRRPSPAQGPAGGPGRGPGQPGARGQRPRPGRARPRHRRAALRQRPAGGRAGLARRPARPRGRRLGGRRTPPSMCWARAASAAACRWARSAEGPGRWEAQRGGLAAPGEPALFVSQRGTRLSDSQVRSRLRQLAWPRACPPRCTRTCCATASLRTCCSPAATCARCRSCWATPASAPPRSTPSWTSSTWPRCTTRPTRGQAQVRRRLRPPQTRCRARAWACSSSRKAGWAMAIRAATRSCEGVRAAGHAVLGHHVVHVVLAGAHMGARVSVGRCARRCRPWRWRAAP